MTRSTTLCIAVCLLALSQAASAATARDLSRETRACLSCHQREAEVLSGPMAMRSGERAFARRAFGEAEGERFFAQSCSGCHVSGCEDCHAANGHRAARPDNDVCLRCHRGYSAGWEYEGKAPREDHSRFLRGPLSQGEHFLKMLPDIHFEHGMTCADCHAMDSLHIGGRAKACIDCHPSPSRDVPEHAISAHLEKMQCTACHAAWASQEYGTFLIRADSDEQVRAFAEVRKVGSWRKSAHLKRQDASPLGVDLEGKVAPIRPRFILFVTDLERGWENHLAAAEWRVFAPHTIRRGSVACGGCHDNARRFILESNADRIYLLESDGIQLASYWDREGQKVVNGGFIEADRFERMNRKTPEFSRQVVRQWQRLLDRAAPRSAR